MKAYDLTKKNCSVDKVYHAELKAGNYEAIKKQYRDPATKYAFQVLDGDIQACQMMKLDSFRHVQDLRRITEDDSFHYHYDLKKCKAILNFAKLVPDVSVGHPLPLMLWQKKVLCSMQGWRDDNGQKRYDRVLMSVARTNGKTYLSNILNAYAFLIEASDYWNQDLAYIAPVTQQAKKGFSYLKTTFHALEKIPAFKRVFRENDIAVLDDTIISRKRQNKLMRLSHESGMFDSYHLLFCVGDEQGSDQKLGKIKVNSGKITSGQVQTQNHQFFQISTAYPDSNSYFYHDERMLETTMKQDSKRDLDNYLCMVWEQDSLKETEQPQTWIKSNPILGLTNKRTTMMKSLLDERDTKMNDGTLAEFQNKSLNMWLQVKQNTYLSLEDINQAIVKQPPINIDGQECYIGFDKSNFSDDTALSFVFPYIDDNNQPQWYIKQHSWIPLARTQNNIDIKEKQDGINYRQAEKLGLCDIAKNDYGYIDDETVYHWLLDYVEKHHLKVQYFCYDKWCANKIIDWVDQKTDWLTLPVQQTIQRLNEPTVDFRKQMDTHHIKYDDDMILIYALKNAVLFGNNNGVKIDKEKQTTKIDMVDATIDAWFMAMYHFDGLDFSKKNSKNPLENMSNDQINDYFSNHFSF